MDYPGNANVAFSVLYSNEVQFIKAVEEDAGMNQNILNAEGVTAALLQALVSIARETLEGKALLQAAGVTEYMVDDHWCKLDA